MGKMDKVTLHLALLGQPEIRLGGALLSGGVPLKGMALLAYLALTGQPCSREKLAGLLWGETPDAAARASLRVTMNRLPSTLRPFLTLTHHTISLHPELVSTDVMTLETAVSRPNDPVAWQTAVALYRGDFLEGFHVPDAPAFDEWALLERERLRLIVIDLLHRLADDALARQATAEGIVYARRTLALDNWREEAHRLLMQLLALDGQRSNALAQFESCRRLLAENLGVEPTTETVALYEAIKTNTLTPSPPHPLTLPSPTPHNLPASAASFVGRESELAQLAHLLAQPDGRLLTILGPGGVGKTRLALETATRLLAGRLLAGRLVSNPQFADGLFFVPLADFPPGTAVAPVVAEAIGLKLSGPKPPGAQVAAHLRDRHLMLLLDNFEHLLPQAEQLAAWLAAAPGLRLMVTSRERLGLYEEWLVAIGGLDAPTKATGDWAAFAAPQLFIQRARRVYLGFDSAAEQKTILQICRLVGGLPLALELAAAWVRTVSCRDIAHALERHLDFLTSDLRNMPERQRSLRATFDYSWSLLDETEKAVLARLVVFQGGFAGPAAVQVTGIALRQLSALVDKSLVQRQANGRYQLHEVIRQFAQEQLGTEGWAAVRANHAAYYADFWAMQGSKSGGAEAETAFGMLALEVGNGRLAWQWALEHGPETEPLLSQLLPHLSLFYLRRGRSLEAVAWLAEALAVVNDGPLAVRLQHQLAKHEEGMGRFAEAQARLLACLPMRESADLPPFAAAPWEAAPWEADAWEADAWEILGRTQRHLGDVAAAETSFQRSLALHRLVSQPSNIAGVLNSLGVLAKNDGRYVQAITYYTESLDIFRQQGDITGIAVGLINLGNIANVQGDYVQARAHYQESYELATAVKDQPNRAITLLNLGSVARATGDAAAAARYYDESLGLGREMGRGLIVAAALDGLGQTRLLSGDEVGARLALREGLETAVTLQSASMMLTLLASVGRALAGQPVGPVLLALALHHENTPHYVRDEVLAFTAVHHLELPQPATCSLEDGVALALAGLKG